MEKELSVKKAALINATGKYTKIILALVVNSILARILSAEDYGIAAVITVFSTFFITFADMGFGPAIIQKKDLTKIDIDNIYSFTVYISMVLAALFIVLSYPIASFYKNPIYINLGQLLSISLFFNALNMVPNGVLNRDKRFISIAIRTVVVYIVSAVITIVMAFGGLRYYALVIQAILTAFFTYIWNYYTTRPKFQLSIDKKSIIKVLNYSSYQFAFNVVNYFSRNLDNLLTGKFMGNAQLGYYNKAYTLMLYPVNNLAGVISPVLHPILSDYQKEKEVIYNKYMKMVRLLACVGIYVAPICFLAAPEIINILYGSNWSKSVVCFQLLSIAIVPQMINASSGAIFQAINNTKLLFINSCINTVITVGAILCGVFGGRSIISLAAFVAMAYWCHFITATFMLIVKGFDYKITKYLKEIIPEIMILFVMVIGTSLYPLKSNNIFLSIIFKCIYLSVIYLIALLGSKEYTLFRSLFKK